jgi:hypothetical protein
MLQKIITNLVPLFSESELAPDTELKVKPKTFRNCLADIFNEMIFDRKIPLAKVQRETNIPFPTLDDWIKGRSCPLADDNLMVLTKYLDTNLEYLCFGIGCEDSRQTQSQRVADFFGCDLETVEMIMDGSLKKDTDADKEELENMAKESIEWQMKA